MTTRDVGHFLPIHFNIDGTPAKIMAPGKPVEWSFRFSAPDTDQPLTRFEPNHGKPMHLIVVSEDLADFAHLHPDYVDPATGQFRVRVNQASQDPDNQDAIKAVPRSGIYHLFGEVTPTGMPTRQAHLSLRAEGTKRIIPLELDPLQPSGEIQKFFSKDSRPGAAGDAYQVSLRIERGEHHPGMPMVTFTFNIQERVGDRYVDVKNLVPWLGMPGHAVLIGQEGVPASQKTFLHLHGAHGEHNAHVEGDGHGGHGQEGSGPLIPFMAVGEEVPPPGTYKLWGQFKHRDRIVTFPFVIRL